MKINKSGAKLSAIVSIGEKLRKLSKDTGKQHLMLNRGVPSVVNIDLSEVVKLIEFNSAELQTYPPAQGRLDLRQAINDEFFGGKSDASKIFLTGGGMSALDLAFQTVDVEKIQKFGQSRLVVVLPIACLGATYGAGNTLADSDH